MAIVQAKTINFGFLAEFIMWLMNYRSDLCKNPGAEYLMLGPFNSFGEFIKEKIFNLGTVYWKVCC